MSKQSVNYKKVNAAQTNPRAHAQWKEIERQQGKQIRKEGRVYKRLTLNQAQKEHNEKMWILCKCFAI